MIAAIVLLLMMIDDEANDDTTAHNDVGYCSCCFNTCDVHITPFFTCLRLQYVEYMFTLCADALSLVAQLVGIYYIISAHDYNDMLNVILC